MDGLGCCCQPDAVGLKIFKGGGYKFWWPGARMGTAGTRDWASLDNSPSPRF